MDWAKLAEPFPPEDIEWRIGRDGQKKGGAMWAVALAYVTNRAIMNRLDNVCTPGGWQNKYLPAPDGGIMCGLSIKVGDEWVTKWDGAENTNIDAVKGGMSGSMKRAAVQWGIGRYLYKLTETFVKIDDSGQKYVSSKKGKPSYKWHIPQLPPWALPPNAPAAGNGTDNKQRIPSKRPVNITPEQRVRLNALYEKAGAKSDDGKRDMAAGYQLDLTKSANEIEKVLKRMEADYKEVS